MRIGFYAPFKPLEHPNPSGDLAIARGVVGYLRAQGHQIWSASRIRSRWIYWQPLLWPRLLRDGLAAKRRIHRRPVDLWLTYHCYYKAPDLLGPLVCRSTGLPYVVFQGVYATKYRRRLQTWPGFHLNRWALRSADHVFTNKLVDEQNVGRLVPADRITYIAPGIEPQRFRHDAVARETLRRQWGVGNRPVIVAAAMFRDDVKTQGLLWLIRACAQVGRRKRDFLLVIAGDGQQRPAIQQLAARQLGRRCRLVGKLPPAQMQGLYSAGDIFAFPGIKESLGMVFLEAQACGLPVVAFNNGGIPEVVDHGRTGFLTPSMAELPFVEALIRLIDQSTLRKDMGQAAVLHVRRRHDLTENYKPMNTVLEALAARRPETLGSRKP